MGIRWRWLIGQRRFHPPSLLEAYRPEIGWLTGDTRRTARDTGADGAHMHRLERGRRAGGSFRRHRGEPGFGLPPGRGGWDADVPCPMPRGMRGRSCWRSRFWSALAGYGRGTATPIEASVHIKVQNQPLYCLCSTQPDHATIPATVRRENVAFPDAERGRGPNIDDVGEPRGGCDWDELPEAMAGVGVGCAKDQLRSGVGEQDIE